MENSASPPAWGKVIGILGIVFGIFGLLGGTYEIIMPSMIEMQKEMMESVKESAEAAEMQKRSQCQNNEDISCMENFDGTQYGDPTAVFDTMEKHMTLPSWYPTWAKVNGSLELIFAAGLILASIFMITVKYGATTIFLGALTVSILRNIVSFGVGLSIGSVMAFWTISSAITGFLVDLVLIIVVLVSDRSAYFHKEA